jgi:BolA protein
MRTPEERLILLQSRLKERLGEDFKIIEHAPHLHHGIEGRQGRFTLQIASPLFKGKSVLDCHREVYKAVGDLMKFDIHALIIQIKDS